jgi:hypothetical protein
VESGKKRKDDERGGVISYVELEGSGCAATWGPASLPGGVEVAGRRVSRLATWTASTWKAPQFTLRLGIPFDLRNRQAEDLFFNPLESTLDNITSSVSSKSVIKTRCDIFDNITFRGSM